MQNLHTVAVIAVSKDVPLVAFTCELYHALNANLKVLRLSSSKVAEHLDASVLDKFVDDLGLQRVIVDRRTSVSCTG